MQAVTKKNHKNGSITLPADKELTLRITTRPNDANQRGDIFGGWLMSQIDVAGAIEAAKRAQGMVVTVAVKELRFIKSLFVYDLVSFYAQVEKVGNTSITVSVEVFAQRNYGADVDGEVIKVSDATLVYVAVSAPGHPRPVPKF